MSVTGSEQTLKNLLLALLGDDRCEEKGVLLMTVDFEDWTVSEDHDQNGYGINILKITNDDEAVRQLASIVPTHFASQYATILARLGKPHAAAYLSRKLPTSKSIMSGDLGEIIATEYINSETDFETPIKRLRWKDHRNMSMRGDDAIGIFFPEDNIKDIAFLKVEAKSRQALSQGVVNTAREALESHEGRPSPHSLGFVADRLYEMEEEEKADQIILFQSKIDVDDEQIEHMLFTYSANGPESYLKTDQASCDSNYYQNTVGVYSASHTSIIQKVFAVIGDDE
jgi:HamA